MGRFFNRGRGRLARRGGQTLVEYSLIISLVCLVAMSVLEEVGIHIKGSIAGADCAMIWAQHNISDGNAAEIGAAWTEINTALNNTFSSSKAGEQAMKAKVLAKQLELKTKFLGTNGGSGGSGH